LKPLASTTKRPERSPLGAGRYAYLVPATGAVELNGVKLDARDGAAIRDESVLRVTAAEDAELVLVDVAA
jgi:redox-sensitive bicupin YhaK (pirin superfamily)